MTVNGFQSQYVELDTAKLFLERGGTGPPVLLLHGYPETHIAWRKVAPELAANWFWLAQSSTLTEAMIGAHPELYLQHIVNEWGGSKAIEGEAMAEYARCMKNRQVIHAMCEDYRAGDGIDLEHERLDRVNGRRIQCPVLVLWAKGGLTEQFGDPIAIWRSWADSVSGHEMSTGHFIMEESPQKTGALLTTFLAGLFAG